MNGVKTIWFEWYFIQMINDATLQVSWNFRITELLLLLLLLLLSKSSKLNFF